MRKALTPDNELARQMKRRGDAPKTLPHSFGFRQGADLDKPGKLVDELESETLAVAIAWAMMLGFIRLTTKRKVVARPRPVAIVVRSYISVLRS